MSKFSELGQWVLTLNSTIRVREERSVAGALQPTYQRRKSEEDVIWGVSITGEDGGGGKTDGGSILPLGNQHRKKAEESVHAPQNGWAQGRLHL